MRVLLVSSEVYPLAKTGGLGDFCAGFAKALAAAGDDVHVLVPGYGSALDGARTDGPTIDLGLWPGFGHVRLVPTTLPGAAVRVWLMACDPLFARDGGLYIDADGADWPDNDRRFALLSRVAAALALGRLPVGWQPDVVHLNDWQTAPVAALLADAPGPTPPTVLTIHNLAFQGLFAPSALETVGLPPRTFTPDGVEFHGQVSYLKAGLCYADRLTTVSDSYAREILTPEFGCGLDGLLRARRDDLTGIVNGADYDVWTPERNPHLTADYSADDVEGKAACKRELCQELGLAGDGPLVAFMSRLTHQKMADVVADAVPALVESGARVVVHGQGQAEIERTVTGLQRHLPGRVAARVGYEESLAHRILAGSDLLLAPARFEPCGLTQLYALRYGAVPCVTGVGGLRDTVVHANDGSIAAGRATGVVFERQTVDALVSAARHALMLFWRPDMWRRIQIAGMRTDFSWSRSAGRYREIYDRLAPGKAPATRPTPVPRALAA